MFIHLVFFWLKPGAGEGAKASLRRDCTELLSRIPTVRSIYAGKPAMTPRDVVDNSYDVGLCVVLDDSAGHDVYQSHELHKQFLERNKANFDRIRVYDFV